MPTDAFCEPVALAVAAPAALPADAKKGVP